MSTVQNVRDKQREETRKRLYVAALDVYRRDGMQACRVEDIARGAGVSRAAFYFHFPTKEDVILELVRQAEEPLFEKLSALPDTTPFADVLGLLAKETAETWKDQRALIPDMAAVSLRYSASLNDREAQPVRNEVARRFVLAAQRKELTDLLPGEALADFYLSNVLAAMMAWSSAPQLELEVALAGVTHLFLNGARGP